MYISMKVALEKVIQRDLDIFFNKILNDVLKILKLSGGLTTLDKYEDEGSEILKKHYLRVLKNFLENGNSRIVKEQKKDENKTLEKASIGIIVLALLGYAEYESKNQIKFILKTLEKDFSDKYKEARYETVDMGFSDKKDEKTIKIFKKNAKKTIKNRIATTSLTETQGFSQKTKTAENYIKSRALDISDESPNRVLEALKESEKGLKDETYDLLTKGQVSPRALKFKTMKKRWSAVLDSATRDAHAYADGQEQQADQPFIVNGEKLMEPRDTSFGASLGNVINCRCEAYYYEV